MAGCFDAEYDSKSVKYCAWQYAMEYGWDIEERCYRLCEKFLDVSVLDYATACELALRTKAVELARGAPAIPW
eukprot:5411598-Karenia_brevis.AAC.1